MPRRPDSEWAEIQARWEAGESQASLVKAYKLTAETIRKHRQDEGWVRSGSAPQREPGDAVPKLVTLSEPQPEPSPIREKVDAAVGGDDRDRRIAELEAELSKYKPANVEWALDEGAAARMLADDLEQMIETELEDTNLERAKRGAPYITIEEMKQKRPKWYDAQVDRIIRETVDNLTRWALASGEATRTLAMVDRDGKIRQVPLDEGIGNFGLSPREYIENKKRNGFRDTKQRKCLRQDCWLPPNAQYQAKGFAELLGLEGFLGYCGAHHFSLDPVVSAGKLPMAEATTATTTASFSG